MARMNSHVQTVFRVKGADGHGLPRREATHRGQVSGTPGSQPRLATIRY